MTKVLAAFWDGWGRVLRAPAILAGVFAVTLMAALPALQARGGQGLGEGFFDLMVYGPAAGFSPAYTPTLLGTGRFLQYLRGFLANGELPAAFVAAVATTLIVWTFLLGGILDRYARRRPTRAQAFFGASGVCFFRFLRLGIVAAIGYWVLFGAVHPLLFPAEYPFVGDEAAARVSPLSAPVYSVFLLFAACWSAVVDYARIRAVVEDRRSMLGALVAGWRFATMHPLQTFGLYLLNAAAFGVFAWGVIAVLTSGRHSLMPAAGNWLAIGLVVLGRVALKLVFFASQTALFQRSLAHADYTAAPEPLWPESPSAEAIINAAPRVPNPETRIPGA